MDIFKQVLPKRILDITNYTIRSTVLSSKTSCFEIAYNFEVHTISVKDDETKSLWLTALRSSFIKYSQFNEEQLPSLLIKEPLSIITEDIKNIETYQLLLSLLTIPSNRICADCLFREVNSIDLDYGVFLCYSCSQIHMKLMDLP